MSDDIARAALELCWEIEKLPASEQQTAVSVRASDLYQKLAAMTASRDAAVQEAGRMTKALTETRSVLGKINTYAKDRALVTRCFALINSALAPSPGDGVGKETK